MHDGFRFVVHDLMEEKKVIFNTPEELHDMLVFIEAPPHYVIKHVFRKGGDEPVAVTSTHKLFLMAGRNVGKDDPVIAVRARAGCPQWARCWKPLPSHMPWPDGCGAAIMEVVVGVAYDNGGLCPG